MTQLNKTFFPLFYVMLLCSLSWQTKAQTLFEGFENWTATLGTHVPNGWDAYAIVTNTDSSAFVNVSRVPALSEGQYALQITNGGVYGIEGLADNQISFPFDYPGSLVDITFTARCEGEGFCGFGMSPEAQHWLVEAGGNEVYTVVLEDIFIRGRFGPTSLLFFATSKSISEIGPAYDGVSFLTIDDLQISSSVEPVSCNTNNPLTMPWLSEIIENTNNCVGSVVQFEYNGLTYFDISPNYDCPAEVRPKYFACDGGLVCTQSADGTEFCDQNLVSANIDNGNTIWSSRYNCDDPFELEIVQNAITNICTDAIYSFEYNNQSYVYIVDHVRCDGIEMYGKLYNCSIGEVCPLDLCELDAEDIVPLLTEINKIWPEDIDPNEKYPWLNDLVNPEYCAGKATEYTYSEYYTFVLLTYTDEISRLYFQDGTLYCSGEIDYCLSSYNLSEPGNLLFDCTTGNDHLIVYFNNFTCTNDGRFTIEITVTDSVGTPYNGRYGLNTAYGESPIDFIYFSEGETIIYEGNIADASNSLYTIYVFDRNLADDAAQRIEIEIAECLTGGLIFDQYSWLYDQINPNNCNAGEKVSEYNTGSYSFVFVEDNDGGKLYFEDGTFYCANSPDYDCVTLYGLNTPTANWACENLTEGCEIEDPLNWAQTSGGTDVWVYQFEGNTFYYVEYNVDAPDVDIYGPAVFDCNGVQVCLFCGPAVDRDEMELIWKSSPNEIFSIYPWLSTLVDLTNCNNTSIQVYAYDSFKFISIEDNEGINLYFQDGAFYCADGLNYSCTQLYSLKELENEWICEGINHKQVAKIITQKIDFDINFKTYPNPSNGLFTVELNVQNIEGSQLNIINLEGKLLQSLQIESYQNNVEINLSKEPKGIYIIQLQNNTYTKTKKMIIR